MQYRKIGESGINASVIALGAWQIGGFKWGGTDQAESIRVIHAALDAGINLIDTAPSYGLGLSEDILGKALKGRREKVALATKCGLVWHTDKGIYHFDEYGRSVYRYLGAESIRYEVEQSLKRLGTDYIDLYQTHRQDPTTPLGETMEVLLDLKKEGKIRAIGVSNVSTEQVKEYLLYGGISSVQELYSMLDRDIEQELKSFCESNGISVLAYSPLAKGLLSGKIGPERQFNGDDQRIDNPRFSRDNLLKIADLLAKFQPIAEVHSISMAQLAIAWTFYQPGVTHVICGTQKKQQVIENAAAGDVMLLGEEIAYMNTVISRGAGEPFLK